MSGRTPANVTAGPAAADGSGLARWIQYGLVVLVAVMPFHAFLSVWAGHLAGHEAIWESWKEVLLAVLTALALISGLRQPAWWQRLKSPAVFLMAGFTLVALLVTLVARAPLTGAVYGLKIDLEFLLAFGLALLVGERRLVDRLRRTILISSGVVIAFGLLQVYVLPHNWLVHFGYGPNTVQPYELVDSSLHSVRIIATLGGANQLGSWLLLPLALVLWQAARRPQWWQALYLAVGALVLWHTYSRSALLGLAVVVVLALLRLPRRWRLPVVAAMVAIGVAGLLVATHDAKTNAKLQYYLFHQTAGASGDVGSTNQHALANQHGLSVALHHPLGEGLGSAGPASYHTARPLIPENYYLQLAIETGVVGLALFVAAEIMVGWQLWRAAHRVPDAAAVVATLVGISVINLFLHGWADSSTALIFWSFAGVVVGSHYYDSKHYDARHRGARHE